MDIQLFVVIIIGIAVGFILLRNLYRFFFTKRNTSFCAGCKGCEPIKKHIS